MKLRLILITLLLGSLLTPLALAQGIRQVAYELVIVELTISDLTLLNISLPEPSRLWDSGVTSVTRLVHSPSLIQILQTGASLLQITASRQQMQNAKLAHPLITVTPGETGTFSLITEEWVKDPQEETFQEYQYGLELLLTPWQVSSDGQQVYTDLSVSTSSSQALLASVWTESGTLQPIGILTYQQRITETKTFYAEKLAQTRYFAVYLRAEVLSHITEDAVFNVGSLGGLPTLLWPIDIKSEPSSLTVAMPLYQLASPEISLKWWLKRSLQLEISASEAPLSVVLGIPLSKQQLLLQSQLIWDDSQAFLAFGVADQVQVTPGVTLSAGFYPFNIDLKQRELQCKPHWWAQIEAEKNRFYGSLKYDHRTNAHNLKSVLGYRWKPQNMIFLQFKTDLKDKHGLGVGYSRDF